MSKEIQLVVALNENRVRIDSYLAQKSELGLSRNYIQQLINTGKIRIEGKPVKVSHKISSNEIIEIQIPDPEPLDLTPENIQLEIVYEDEDVLVINKSAGLVVHPGSGVKEGTLVNALLYHCKNLSGIGGKERPGIVHRLDKGTSGLIMVAKTDLAHQSLSKELKERTIRREYTALVHGIVKKEKGFIETYIGRHPTDRKKMAVLKEGGRMAGTHYEVIQKYPGKISFSLIRCQLTTGRTHQIRVHLSHLGNPVVGDSIYGTSSISQLGKNWQEKIDNLNGHALHAGLLGFHHPRTKIYLEFKSDLPKGFQEFLDFLIAR